MVEVLHYYFIILYLLHHYKQPPSVAVLDCIASITQMTAKRLNDIKIRVIPLRTGLTTFPSGTFYIGN